MMYCVKLGMLHTDSMSHELTAEEGGTSLGGEDGAKMMQQHGLLEKVGTPCDVTRRA